MDSGKAAGESDPRLIHTGYGQYSAGHRMSTRLRVFVWIVVVALVAFWLAAIWYVVIQPKWPLPFLPLKPS
jgi:hypothetical protein